jgi:SNF2 family DNA or RNA helicase
MEATQLIPFNKSDPIWRRIPFEHQTDMARFHYSVRNGMDLSEVGCAKTQPAIAAIRRLINEHRIISVLIICRNSAIGNWLREFELSAPEMDVVALRGDKKKRVELLAQPGGAVCIINYEGVRVIYKELIAKHWDLILCDEVHAIKSYKGSKNTPTQSWMIRQLGKNALCRKGLTGTVLTNDIMDLWAICEFIDPKIFSTNQWGYRNKYMHNANATKPWLPFPDWQPRAGAVEEIQKLIAPHCIRFEKAEVMKFLPPVLFQQRVVELTGDQKKAYNELKKQFVIELDDGTEFAALNALVRLNKLLQVCSGFLYREGEAPYRFEKNAKLAELRTVLEDIGNHRVIIWCAYKDDANLIGQLLIDMKKENRFAFITGNTRESMRQDLIDVFNKDGLQYLVCNPSCAGESLNIMAPYAVIYSRNHKLGERIQLLGRNHRPGAEQFSNLTVIDILADVASEHEVMAALDGKKELLQTINPESFRRMLG